MWYLLKNHKQVHQNFLNNQKKNEQSFENYNHYHKSISIDMKGNDLYIKYTEVMILDQLLSEELISPSFHKLNLQEFFCQ